MNKKSYKYEPAICSNQALFIDTFDRLAQSRVTIALSQLPYRYYYLVFTYLKKEQISEIFFERTQSEDPTVQCSVTDLLTTAVKVKVTLQICLSGHVLFPCSEI